MHTRAEPPFALPEPQTCRRGSLCIELFRRGLNRYQKTSYPARSGIYHSIETAEARMDFNLNHEIIRLAGRDRNWPHPQEWLKRTLANDWIYYSTGGYTGVYETTGEFYLPNLSYLTNNHLGGRPLLNQAVAGLLESWPEQLRRLQPVADDLSAPYRSALQRIFAIDPLTLAEKAGNLHRIIGGPVSVLPPDTRHVDYQVLPLNIADGCLYKCGFCRVKNNRGFRQKTVAEIDDQIEQLGALLAADLVNFNGLFLGQHDGLNCDAKTICHAIERAQLKLHLANSYIKGSSTFLFGSVQSLLEAETSLFDELERLPGTVYINIGLESADQQTLDILEKPVGAGDVARAFDRAQRINRRCASIEVTANFITDPDLPGAHYQAMLKLIRERLESKRHKGCIYLSPLRFGDPSRARLFDFYKLKRLSRLPLFMYTIQRL
jgi:hypothetical protein